MKSLFWIAINQIGFIVLAFMYANKGKAGVKRNLSQRLVEYLQLSIMLYIIADTGMYAFDGMIFGGAYILHYISTAVFYISSVLPGLFYVIYCDSKVFASEEGKRGFKKRVIVYALPAAANALITLLNPLTDMMFTIDGNNTYARGDYFLISTVLSFIYILSVFPLLAAKGKTKISLLPKGTGIYLYLFPIPPAVLAIIQAANYGVLLIGIGFVISSLFIYLNDIQSSEGGRSLSARFFYANIMQFSVISLVMIATSLWLTSNMANDISEDYAAYQSVGTASVLSNYLGKEIGVLGAAARSQAVIDWLCDENDVAKKLVAYYELRGSMSALHSENIYVVAGQSGQEYWLVADTAFDDFQVRGTVSPDNESDAWVYELMGMPFEYNLNVDFAKGTEVTDVWINFKVMGEGRAVGIICTRMVFSDIIGQLLAQIDSEKKRVIIIDENGVIQVDSALINDGDVFLQNDSKTIREVMSNPEFLTVLEAYLDGFDGYYDDLYKESTVIDLFVGKYRYATLMPIGSTNWSVVTLYDSSSLFSIIRMLPLFVIITVLFILFAFSSNSITQRLIFAPLKQLVDSLLRMRKNSDNDIYGISRSDEIGLLSNTIKEFFIKGHYDELTGIHNRRYFEITMQQIMTTLSRTDSKLSIMLVDVDYFKKYNDTYGHSEGDKCLKAVAETLNGVIIRKGDFVARYGGEEFVVVLPNTDESGARHMAEKMLESVRLCNIPHEKNEAASCVTISIGVTTGTALHTQSRDDYVKRADEALYMSKQNGRNRYTYLDFCSDN